MKSSRNEKIFYAVNYTILIIVGLICLLPLIYIISLSISDGDAVAAGKVGLWPVGVTTESYRYLLEGTRIVGAFKNSVAITIVGVLLSMLFTILAAYPLSRVYFYYRRFFTLAIVFTMLFQGGIIPTFLVVKNLGLINSFSAIWGVNLISVFNMLVLKTFFEGIPRELEEAARMDGCSEIRLLRQIVLRLSIPALVTVGLFYGVGYWNVFMQMIMFINKTDKYNLTVLVQQMIRSQQLIAEMLATNPGAAQDVGAFTAEGIKSAGVIVLVAPMLIIYPFLQRFFVKGVMIGAVKG